MDNFAPVLIPTLNRDVHFKRCVESLSKCTHADKTDLYIAFDYPLKDIHWDGYRQIEKYLNKIKGFKSVSIIKRDENYGVRKNINNARKTIFEKYDSIIFSEDDNEFSPNFLDYINKGLDKFENDQRITAICGYNYPIKMSRSYTDKDYYYSKKFAGWGYGSWRNRKIRYEISTQELTKVVKDIQLINKLIRYHGLHILQNYLGYIKFKRDKFGDGAITLQLTMNNEFCVFPSISKVRNHGHDGTGVNCGRLSSNIYSNQHIDDKSYFDFYEKPIQIDSEVLKILKSFTSLSIKAWLSLFFEVPRFIMKEYIIK